MYYLADGKPNFEINAIKWKKKTRQFCMLEDVLLGADKNVFAVYEHPHSSG